MADVAAPSSPHRVLVLQHEDTVPSGILGEWAVDRGFELQLLPSDGAWSSPPLDDVAFVVSLGSRSSSHDDAVPWLARELELLADAHARDVPVLGLCFGAQALARALGASTHRAPSVEAGWRELDLVEDSVVTPGPWLFWHEDAFEVPPGAQLLARTAIGPAAFVAGRSLGLQFHPEVGPEIVDLWLDRQGHELSAEQRDDLHDGVHDDPGAVRARARALFDRFVDRCVANGEHS